MVARIETEDLSGWISKELIPGREERIWVIFWVEAGRDEMANSVWRGVGRSEGVGVIVSLLLVDLEGESK